MQRVGIIVLCIVSVWALPFKGSRSKSVPFKIDPRIINGEKATRGQFPWQVAIYVSQPGITQLCGGALISDSWVLTAAHCVQDASSFRIAIGSNTLSGTDSSRVVVNTDQYIQHEGFSRLTLANDIAVIPLPQPVGLNDDIQPISLASGEDSPGTGVTVSGWGLTSDGGDGASNDLNYVDLVIISNSDCESAYSSILTDGVLCAQGAGAVARSTCEGDSGGPLVTGASSNPRHVGIVSFGHSDGCESGKPGGFSSTDYYRDWIRQKTGV